MSHGAGARSRGKTNSPEQSRFGKLGPYRPAGGEGDTTLVASSNITAKIGYHSLDWSGRICDGVLCVNMPNSNLRRTAVGPLPAFMAFTPLPFIRRAY